MHFSIPSFYINNYLIVWHKTSYSICYIDIILFSAQTIFLFGAFLLEEKKSWFIVMFSFLLLIRYFLYLHFKCYLLSWFPLQKAPIRSPSPCSPTHPLLLPCPGISLYWGIKPSQDQASPPIDVWQGHSLLHMHLETWVPPCVLFGWCFSP